MKGAPRVRAPEVAGRPMMPAPPDSILPPAPKTRPSVAAAAGATLITAALAALGYWFSFWLAHGAGTVTQVLVLLVAWPAIGVLAGLASGMLPGYLFYPLLLVAEWLYVWGILLLAMKVAARRRRGGGVNRPVAGS